MSNRRPIRKREAQQIIQALEGGIVPRMGLRHLLVGRQAQVREVADRLSRVEEGGSDLMIWVGDFGSGKSFMLGAIQQLALQKNFVASTVDLSPSRRFQASDGKGLALYQEVIRRLQSRTSGEGNALAHILDAWMAGLGEDFDVVQEKIFASVEDFQTGGLRYELGKALVAYASGMMEGNRDRKLQALRWLGGQIPTKTEAKQVLGISQIIRDDNWTLFLQNLAELFRVMGFAGFVVNFDELVNLYKLPRTQSRDQNYERILNLYNDLKSGAVPGLYVNLAATRKTVFDERRGMASYGALKSRIGTEDPGLRDLVDTSSTLQILHPLTPEEIFTLLEKLQDVFLTLYPEGRALLDGEIARYMQAQLNRPGADEFLTPRAVIKDFLLLLQLARQNPEVSAGDILAKQFGQMGRVVRDQDDHDDDVIELL